MLACALLTTDAGAATYDLRPDQDLSLAWNKVGATTAFAALDDAVTEATAVSSADYVWAGGLARTAHLALRTHQLSGEAPSDGRLWFYANTGWLTELRVDVIWGGEVRASTRVPLGAAFGWRSLGVTPPDQGAIDDLSIRFATEIGGDSNVRAAFFRLSTTATSTTTTPPTADLVEEEVCDSAFGTFRAGTWPGACWRPYADSSPFNTPIPGDARVHANSADIVARVVGLGNPDDAVIGTADTSQDWSHPTYYSQPTDPLYTLRCTESWGTCALEGMKIRVPSAARPAGGSDAHMTIVDQAEGWEYPLWGVQSKPSSGGTLWFRWSHGRVKIDGPGTNGGGTAAHFGNLAGIIRAQELAAGHIDHALFMVIRCDAGRYVYPALGRGRACSNTTNAPPMGARFQLDMTAAQIDALAVPPWKKTILRAMATYGAYFGDTGGNAWSVQLESGSTYTSFGFADRMVTFAREANLPSHDGAFRLDLAEDVAWGRYLRVIDPCTTQGRC